MCIPDRFALRRARQAGISLIELVMFIVIVSVGIVGILQVMNITTRHSADPMLRKQALSIAEAMLEEVQLMPLTFCDPDDANASAATTTSAANCADTAMDQDKGGGALTTATPATETRYSLTTPFDNVADYGGFGMAAGISDITGTAIPGLNNYRLQPITITRVAMNGIADDGNALLITVTVTAPSGENISVQGIRTRFAPTAVP
jgi:MSHA pilin protein MshD